jgi:tryptophan synthase alpha subunit
MYYCVAGLVVPDVPLEETNILRSEAAKNNLELVGPLSCYEPFKKALILFCQYCFAATVHN